jgi:hypothetical protein
MSKAANSPLRDKMLELHKQGVDVKFIGEGGAQIFAVKMAAGLPLEDHFKTLEEIRLAINRSVEERASEKLTSGSARQFVESMKKLNT